MHQIRFVASVRLCVRWSLTRTNLVARVVAVVLQATAVATFGGFAAYGEYGASAMWNPRYSYLGWCFWMAVAGTVLTALAAACFIGVDCFGCRRRTHHKAANH